MPASTTRHSWGGQALRRVSMTLERPTYTARYGSRHVRGGPRPYSTARKACTHAAAHRPNRSAPWRATPQHASLDPGSYNRQQACAQPHAWPVAAGALGVCRLRAGGGSTGPSRGEGRITRPPPACLRPLAVRVQMAWNKASGRNGGLAWQAWPPLTAPGPPTSSTRIPGAATAHPLAAVCSALFCCTLLTAYHSMCTHQNIHRLL